MKLLRKLHGLLRRRKIDKEMSEEMRLHLELQTERNIAAGMDPDEARYAARREFGGVEQIKERCRDQRGWVWLEQTMHDFRYAVRSLKRNPGFTVTAVLTLALGIGVNAALFTVYDIIALRPLPCREPDELVEIHGRNELVRGGIDRRFSYPDYLDYCAGNRSFTDIVAVRRIQVRLPAEVLPEADPATESNPGVVTLEAVSGNYFAAIGAGIVLGRDFRPEEARTFSGRAVVVISHLFWQTHLHGDLNVLGKVLTTEDRDGTGRALYTIIGVAARDFGGQALIPPIGWVPLTAVPGAFDDRAGHLVSLLGRMRAGVNATQAKSDLDAVAARLARLYPDEKRATSVQLTPAMRLFYGGLTTRGEAALSALLLGFALVLILACLNVANLLLARGVARQHEIGVRLTLGASRVRIVRQLFTENLVLCLVGAAAGLLFAVWTLHALRPLAAWFLDEADGMGYVVNLVKIGPDRRIVAFTAMLGVVAGFAAGLLPALQSASANLFSLLKDEGSAFGRRIRPARLRHFLAIVQVAVCLAILSVNGIMAGNLVKVRSGALGFSPERVFLVGVTAKNGAPTSSSTPAGLPGTVETLRTLPGVVSACVVRRTPLRTPFENVGSLMVKTPGDLATLERFSLNWVSSGFFETFCVPLRIGRGFTPQEIARDESVAVVSEAAARRLWPGQDAVGQTLSVSTVSARNSGQATETYRNYEVIGVAGDFRSNWASIGDDEPPLVLFPLPRDKLFPGIYVRVQADSASVLSGIVRVAATAGIPLEFRERLSSVVEHGLVPFRVMAWLSGLLAGLALVLATVGLYGIMAFGVNQRVREIGVRVALGATAGKVVTLFVREGMRRAAIGMAWGLAGGVAFAVGVTKLFPKGVIADGAWFRLAVFGVVTVFLAGVALLASWLPARRAAKVDPIVALRCE